MKFPLEKTVFFQGITNLFKFINFIISVEAQVGQNTATKCHLVSTVRKVNNVSKVKYLFFPLRF